jgi:serine/threonine protein kinase
VTMCLQFVHEHLVRLIGVVTLGDPLMVVLEYCEYGSLDSYLKKNDISEEAKVRFGPCLGCEVLGVSLLRVDGHRS